MKLNGSSNNMYVIGTNCSSPTLDMFWIWTGNEQLLNVKNLKCMERKNEEVGMKQCEKGKKTQKIVCTERKMETWGTSNRFLHLTRSKSRVIFKRVQRNNVPQQWSSDKKTLCKTGTAYHGTV